MAGPTTSPGLEPLVEAGAGSDDVVPRQASTALRPSPEFLEKIPHAYARRHLVLSAGEHDGVEQVRGSVSASPAAVFNIGVVLGRCVQRIDADPETLAADIDRAYAEQADRTSGALVGTASGGPRGDQPVLEIQAAGDLESELREAVTQAAEDLLRTDGKAPTVRLVDLVLFEALRCGASDVHIQPLKDRTLVRYRVDGSLHTSRELGGRGMAAGTRSATGLTAAVVSRIKVMARMDVAETRMPQDGRASVSMGSVGAVAGAASAGRRVDLRISTLPSTYGERVVIRILDPARSPHLSSFAALGMPSDMERRYLAQAARTSGIVLSTGPTGSGKTTTLYATLAWISHSNTAQGPTSGALTSRAQAAAAGCELNMMTIEDPVEYDLTDAHLAVSQTQVDPKKNVTFAAGLRHILRQDPDVIMVGEIRDEETARIAVQASLTGHLVLSTLHTSDAAGAVSRLLDLGVEPFLVASSLSAVLAQRLVRKVHEPCRVIDAVTGRAIVGGCEDCHRTGYKGRTGVFELLVLDGVLRELVTERRSAVVIKDAAHARGMTTLREAGMQLVARGCTTPEELARAIECVDEEVASP